MLLDTIVKDSTDYQAMVRVVDSTDGTPETTVAFNTAGVDLWYRRQGGLRVAITEVTQTVDGTHSDGGFVHVSDGYARLDLPDAAVATGADFVDIGGVFTGMVVIGGRIRLTDVDLDDSVRAGMTALPNAAADGALGLPISDAGGLDLDTKLANTNEVTVARMGALTDWIDAGRLDTILDNIENDTSNTLDSFLVDIDARLQDVENGIIYGVCQTGTLTVTACSTDLTGYSDDQLIRGVIVFTSGPADGERSPITDYASTNGLVTYATLQQAPTNGDTFKIV